MKLRAVAVLLFMSFMPGLLVAQAAQDPPVKREDGILSLLQGRTLAYAGDHVGAQRKYLDYWHAHPTDLLIVSRIVLDRWMSGRRDAKRKTGKPNLPNEEFLELRGMLDSAIASFEANGCRGTNLAIVGNTLDCEYVGAALYEYRMGIVGENGSKRQAKNDNYDRFTQLAQESRSLQSLFLLGSAQYPVSRRPWPQPFLANAFGYRANHDEAVKLILRSVEGNASPFVDDALFLIFDAECGCGDSGKKDNAFERSYPFRTVVEYLRGKYPANQDLAAAARRLGLK